MKKTIYKHWWCLMLIALICIGGVSCGNSDQKEQPEKSESVSVTSESVATEPVETKPVVTEPPIPESTSVEYDALQQVFLTLNNDTTIENLNSLIADNDLEYTSQDYNGTPKTTNVKLAYSHDTALQKYAEAGDYVEVVFDKQVGTFLYAEYFNQNAFKTAIYYNYGTYWDFREKEANNSYTGYYYHSPGDNRGGIVIEYSNGNKTETGYHKCSDGKEAIENAIGQ